MPHTHASQKRGLWRVQVAICHKEVSTQSYRTVRPYISKFE